MKSPLSRCKLILKASPIHGYGVFADQDIQPQEVIEECYALLAAGRTADFIDYYFNGKNKADCVLPLGSGAIFNHSSSPNADYLLDQENSLLIFTAKKFIKQGEEIFISYGKDWFSSRKAEAKEPSWRYRLHKYVPTILLWARAAIVMLVFVGIVVVVK